MFMSFSGDVAIMLNHKIIKDISFVLKDRKIDFLLLYFNVKAE